MARSRGRVRSLAVDDVDNSGKVTAAMRAEAKAAYVGNLKKNEGTREETKARATLLALMAAAGVREFQFNPEVNGKRVALEAVHTPEGKASSSIVDLDVLRSKVTDEDFMAIVSATQSAVEKIAGASILAECLRTIQVKKNAACKVSVVKG